MRIRTFVAGLGTAVLLSACGDGDRAGPAPTAPKTFAVKSPAAAGVDSAALFLQVAECFRAHGQPDFPDPVQGADGGWGFPVTAGRMPVPEACQDVVRRVNEVSPYALKSPPAVDLKQARAFTACMRGHGIPDWPDPNPDGTFTIPARLADPSAEQQWKPAATGACKQYQPEDGPEVVLAPPR
ncbi:hypothetical protein [Dactylosporangium sp. NPDC051541]|uniref:hypothetical protein n=1 Tax=Dactylosporangium sp. NPDC051541 TaxID=3363977 RepID=UPI0037AE5D03